MDIVYCTPENYKEAMGLITPLPADELEARCLQFGFRSWDNIPFPNQDGTTQTTADASGKEYPLIGCCICKDIYGSTYFQPAAKKDNKLCIAADLMLSIQKPGLTVGTFKEEVFDKPEFQKKRETHIKADETRIHQIKAERQKQETEYTNQIQNAARRYLVTVAHYCGIKKPAEISVEELADINAAGLIMKRELPDPELWMMTQGPQRPNAIQTEQPDYLATVQAARAAVCVRNEINRGL